MSDQLEKRAVGALTAEPPPSPAALLTLIAEVETGIAAAKAAAETAAKKLLDPIESPDINAARAKVEATEFTGTRLRSLLVRLEDRYELEARAEAAVAWRSKYEALERERDALAKELREVYPTAATRIAVALGRAADLDRRLSQLHQSRPGGAKGTLLGAELVARDLTEFSRDQPPLSRELQLPDWIESNRLAWPPREPPASVMVANAVATIYAISPRTLGSVKSDLVSAPESVDNVFGVARGGLLGVSLRVLQAVPGASRGF